MGSTEEIDLLKSRMKDLEHKLCRVEEFISASAELVAEHKRFLEKEEQVLQTFISSLRNKDVQCVADLQEISVTSRPSTFGPSSLQSENTTERHPVHVSTSPSITIPQLENTAKSPTTQESPSTPQSEDTTELRPSQVSICQRATGFSSPHSENTAESCPAHFSTSNSSGRIIAQSDRQFENTNGPRPTSPQAPIQYSSVIIYEGEPGPSKEQLQNEDGGKISPTRIHCHKQNFKSTSQGSPKSVQSVQLQTTVYTPPVESIIDEIFPSERRFPKRAIKKPLRYGANLYNKYDHITSETASSGDTDNGDQSEEEHTENPLLALGLIPKPDETAFDNPNLSPEVKVEEMEMPILEQIETRDGFQEFELRGGAMPTLDTIVDSHRDAYDNPHAIPLSLPIAKKNPAPTSSKRDMFSSTRAVNRKLAAAISANNRWVKMRTATAKSRRRERDGSKKKKPKVLGEKSPHICNLCGKKLRSLHGLKAHILSHSGAKPFQCSRCDARFSQKSSLNRHIMVHTGEKNFICPACDKAFITRYDLLIHSRVHSRKAQECPSCTKIFFDPRYFNIHVKACSSAEVNKCPKCEKVLKDPKYFRKHVQSCDQTS